MSRGKTVDRTGRLTPARFLGDLGIQRRSPESAYSAFYRRALVRAGGDPDVADLYGGFSPQAGEVFFITEEVARLSLSSEYDWFLDTLRRVSQGAGYPARPRRVADLGGGTGVVGMWLAACHRGCKVVVYDHSPRQLQLGRKWARERNLRTIKYVRASYEELAARAGAGDNDLVLFFRALDLRIPAPRT